MTETNELNLMCGCVMNIKGHIHLCEGHQSWVNEINNSVVKDKRCREVVAFIQNYRDYIYQANKMPVGYKNE